MKKRRLALMMALVMTLTSIDSSALLVSASDAVAEENISAEAAEAEPMETAGEEPAVQEGTAEIIADEAVPEPAAEDETAVPEDVPDEAAASEITAEEMTTETANEAVPETSGETVEEVPAEAEEELIIGEEGSADTSFAEAKTESMLSALSEEHTIQSMSVKPVRTEYAAGLDEYDSSGDEVTVTYADGATDTLICYWDAVTDSYGNQILNEVYAAADTEKSNPYGCGHILPAGEYIAEFTCGEISATYHFTVAELEETASYQGELTTGEEVMIISPADKFAYYSFRPEQSGTYALEVVGGFRVAERTEEGGYNMLSPEGGHGKYRLSAGKTYYIGFHSYGGEEVRSVSFTWQPTLSTVEISGQPTVWSIGSQKGILSGAVFTFKYEDGESQEVLAGDGLDSYIYDSYNYSAHLQFADAQGQCFDNAGELEPGTYTVNVLLDDDTVVATYSLTVNGLNVGEVLLVPGENTGLAAGDDFTYYRFVPEKTGRYSFKGCVDDLSLLLETESGYQERGWNTVSDLDSDMREFQDLFEMGTTYYVGLRNVDAAFVLNVQYVPEILSAQVNPSCDTFIAGWSYGLSVFKNLSVNLEYEEGTSPETVTFPGNGNGVTDSYGNNIGVWMVDADGYEVSYWEPFTAGTYTVKIWGPSGDLASYPVYVKPASEVVTEAISLGTQQVTATVEGEAAVFYRMEVTESGRYLFNCNDGLDISINYYTLEGDTLQNLDVWSPVSLEAGKTYYIRFTQWETENADVNVTVEKLPEVTGFELQDMPEKLQFIEELETPSLRGIQADIAYSTGETTTVRFAYSYNESTTDVYGSRLSYSVYRSGTEEEVPADAVVPGDYIFRVSCEGSAQYTDIPFKVLSLEEACSGTLTSGQAAVLPLEQGEVLCRLTIDHAGTYQVQFNIPVDSVDVIDSEGYGLPAQQETGYRMVISAENAGTYYLYVKAPEQYQKLAAELTAQTEIASITLEVLKKDYIAGLEMFDGRKVRAKVTYEDGTTGTVKESGVLQGCTLHYRVMKSGSETDDEPDLGWGGTMGVGTYTVTPYLTFGSGSAIEIPNAGTAAVQGVRLDVSSIPAIALDTAQSVSYGYLRNLYSFTAPEEGTYKVQAGEGANCRFYYDEEAGLREAGKSISLKQGETCVLVCDSWSAAEICVRKSENTDDPKPDDPKPDDPTKPVALELDQKAQVNITQPGTTRECTFTPAEDGKYSFSSEGEYDTMVYLYCNGELLADNDDGDVGNNFTLTYALKAGQTYTYKAGFYGEAATGSYSVLLRKVIEKEITNVSIIGDEADYTMFRNYREVFSLQVTYADETTETRQLYSGKDSYGNSFSVRAQSAAAGETIIVRFGKEEQSSSEWNQTSRVVKAKGFADFEKIAAGESKTFSVTSVPGGSKEWDYAFAPQETGEYAWSCGYTADFSCWYQIVQLTGDNYQIVDTGFVSDGESSAWMTAGRSYIIRVYVESYAEAAESITAPVTINSRKMKRLTDLVVTKQPADTTVIKGLDAAALDGLQAKAVYEDGSEELLTIGQKDSQGRELSADTGWWINDNLFHQEIRLGSLKTSINLTAGSSENLPALKAAQENQLTARNDYRFVPEKTGAYQFALSGPATRLTVYCENDDEYITGPYGYYFPEAGKTYLIAIRGVAAPGTVMPVLDGCRWIVTEQKDATCEEDGILRETCQTHGDVRETVFPALGHSYTKEISVSEPTCAAAGKRVLQCANCGDLHETVIPATGKHNYIWKTDKQATCGAAGSKHQECTVCGTKTAATAIPATGAHRYGGWVVTKEATVLAQGVRQRTCTVCKKAVEKAAIAKLPRKISLTANSLVMKVKQSTTKFKVTEMAKGDYLKSVVSSDTKLLNVSGVNKNGSVKLTAQKKTGKVNLTFTLASGASKTIKVTIQKGAVKTTSITGVQKNITIKQGNTVKLTPSLLPVTSVEKISYKTSNKKVATVSSKGVIKGIKGGTAKIYVKAGKKTFTCTVKVEGVKTTSLKNVPSKISLKKKKSYTLKPKRVPAASADAISYSSSNKKVATVNSKGKITAKSKGTAVITVKCGKAIVRCTVTVK